MFGANLVILAQIHYKLSRGQAQFIRVNMYDTFATRVVLFYHVIESI